jgi:hypothetical protein
LVSYPAQRTRRAQRQVFTLDDLSETSLTRLSTDGFNLRLVHTGDKVDIQIEIV